MVGSDIFTGIGPLSETGCGKGADAKSEERTEFRKLGHGNSHCADFNRNGNRARGDETKEMAREAGSLFGTKKDGTNVLLFVPGGQ